MKKALLFSLFLPAILSLPLAAQTPQSLEQALNAGADYFSRQIPRNSRIAVLVPEAPTEALGLHTARSLQALLVNSGALTMLERDRAGLAATEAELVYQTTGMVSDETALGLGKMLGAELVLTGRMTREPSGYRLEYRAVAVETGRIAGAWSAAGIRRDAELAALDPPRRQRAVLEFAGALVPDAATQAVFLRELTALLQAHGIPLDIPEAPGPEPAPWRIVITLNGRERPPARPANTSLVTGDMSLALYRETLNLRQSRRQNISELGHEEFYRRALEELRNREDFFQAIKADIPPSGE